MAKRPPRHRLKIFLRLLFGLIFISISCLIYFVIAANVYRLPRAIRNAPIGAPGPREIFSPSSGEALSFIFSAPETKWENNDEYLKACLEANPGLQSAALIPAISKRMEIEKIIEQFDQHFSSDGTTYTVCHDTVPDEPQTTQTIAAAAMAPPDSQTLYHDVVTTVPALLKNPYIPEQIKWLRDHSALLDSIRRLSRCEWIPQLTIREALSKSGFPTQDFLKCLCLAKMLVAEGWLDYQRGDYAAARQSIQDAYALACLVGNDDVLINRLIGTAMLDIIHRPIEYWIKDPHFPQNELAELLKTLERIDPLYFSPDALKRIYIGEYLTSRKIIVDEMVKPSWVSPVYGWGGYESVGDSFCAWPVEYTTYCDLPYFGTTKIPLLPKIISHASRAMYRRLDSEKALKEFDDINLNAIELAGQRYSDFRKNETQYSDKSRDQYFLAKMTGRFAALAIKVKFLCSEAKMHLIRLGLGLRTDPGHTMAMRDDCFAENPNHPWRDPFSEKPMQTDRACSPTLIYSLGPDMTDQKGRIEYDPSNGTVSAGDIVIRCQ